MKEFSYRPDSSKGGICPSRLIIHLNDDNTLEDVIFFGGCPGNHLGLNALCRGMKPEDIIPRLKGIKCGNRPTSCPDFLAYSLEDVLEKINGNSQN